MTSEFLSPSEERVIEIITPMAGAGEDQIEESVIVVCDVSGPSTEKEVGKASEYISKRHIKLSLLTT